MREGANIAIIDRDASLAEETASALHAEGGQADAYIRDVTNVDGAKATIKEIEQSLGPVDVLLTAAGISRGLRLVDTPEEVWDEVFAINVKGTFAWMRAVLPGMIARERGSIITFASQLAFAGGQSNAAYIASKGAIVSLTRTVALENAEFGVRVNTIAPGATETPMLNRSMGRDADPSAARERSRTRHAMKRFGQPDDIANGALYLASDESTFVTGIELVIDGGWLVA